MSAWKRIVHVFDGTKECHAKLDEAAAKARQTCERAELILSGVGADEHAAASSSNARSHLAGDTAQESP